MSIFNEFGFNGTNILILLSMYLLWDHNNLFFFYIVGLICDSLLNVILKGIIQQPRPNFDSKEIQLALKNNTRFFYKDGIPYNLFGMPSGHASSALFSTMFVYIALRKTNWLYVYLIMDAIIMYQRVTSNDHSIAQIIVGALVGIGVAYIFYQFAEKKIKGRIREKLDDFGPIHLFHL
jgi:membrane-associated phospholipid phosphatase